MHGLLAIVIYGCLGVGKVICVLSMGSQNFKYVEPIVLVIFAYILFICCLGVCLLGARESWWKHVSKCVVYMSLIGNPL